MDMKTHIVRAVKYLIWLALLFTLVFALMISTGTSRVGAGEALHELFGSSRGMLMIATIVVLALLYPRFGFTRRSVRADLKADRERILQTLHTSGYSLVAESEGTMIFRASSPLKRALLLWEDRIAVTADGESITLDGIRKEVVRAEFRLTSFLEQ